MTTSSKKYPPIIGLEIHVELKTNSKMFCGCSGEHFAVKPNTHTCPVCLGLPGALPVPNQKAIEWCQLIGLALGCQLNLESKFDRKNYFYPDLPKGYQISQYDMPLCQGGEVGLASGKKIRITRVHMEEDTGKLLHTSLQGKEVSLVDFNRSGVPLVEIVTEPDIRSVEEADELLKKVQQIVRYLGVSDCDMEKGSMRLEVNMSLAKFKDQSSKIKTTRLAKATAKRAAQNLKLPDYKVEVKNINSFRFVRRAIDYEYQRQAEILDKGETPEQETRGFSEAKGMTQSQRSKEEAHDYRYFPEPDIPPLEFTAKEIEGLEKLLPESPQEKQARFIKEYQLMPQQATVLTATRAKADYYEEAVSVGKDHGITPAKIANVIINKNLNLEKVLPAHLVKLLAESNARVSDEATLRPLAEQAIAANPKAVADYRSGKTQVIGVLMGAVMKASSGKANPKITRQILEELLKN